MSFLQSLCPAGRSPAPMALCTESCPHWLPCVPNCKLVKGDKHVTLSCIPSPSRTHKECAK